MPDAPDEPDSLPAFERIAQLSVSDEGECALPPTLEGAGQPQDVLSFGERSETEEYGSFGLPPELAPCVYRVSDRKALEVDAGVDDLDLPGCLGDSRLELPAQPVRDGDDRGRAAHDIPCRRADTWNCSNVAHVLAVRSNHERSPRSEGADQAGRNEEVGVDDVGPEAACEREGPGRETEVSAAPALAPVENGTLDLVPSVGELALERRDEDAEVRVCRPRIHLRDEEDPQRRPIRASPGGSPGTSRPSFLRPTAHSAGSARPPCRGASACRRRSGR